MFENVDDCYVIWNGILCPEYVCFHSDPKDSKTVTMTIPTAKERQGHNLDYIGCIGVLEPLQQQSLA